MLPYLCRDNEINEEDQFCILALVFNYLNLHLFRFFSLIINLLLYNIMKNKSSSLIITPFTYFYYYSWYHNFLTLPTPFDLVFIVYTIYIYKVKTNNLTT